MARRNLGQMRSSVHRRLGTHSQIVAADINAILQDVHREIAAGFQWSFRKRETLLATVAPYTTGTVAVSPGSSTVTGTLTVWTSAMVGRAIRIAGEDAYFFVQAVTDGTHLTLGDAQGAVMTWAAAAGSLLTYTIFQHQYQLASDVAVILEKIREWPLTERTVEWMNERDPDRSSTGDPNSFAMARARHVSGVEQVFVELWPVPSSARRYRMTYLVEPPDLTVDADLPVCPSEPIEWRAAAEAAWFLYSKTGDPRWDQLGRSYYQVYAGNPAAGEEGVLERARRDDEHRFGLPRIVGDGPVVIGANDLGFRDWDLMD